MLQNIPAPCAAELSDAQRCLLELDVFAHTFWTAAAALAARRKFDRPIHLGWAAAWGVAPDLAAFAIPAAMRIWRFASGASHSLLPDGRGPNFHWVWGLYNATHSAVLFAACFAAVWMIMRRPVLEMLGWLLHIVIDIFTHRGIFSIQFLWPLSGIHVEGIRWEEPWLLAANYATLALVFLMFWRRRENARLTPRPQPNRRAASLPRSAHPDTDQPR